MLRRKYTGWVRAFIGLGMAMGLIALGSSPVEALIAGSPHDFSAFGWADSQICLPCHTPHNADTSVADAPLWSHEVTAATFTTYSSSTLDATDVGQPAGTSKLCLSCHDGTVALDSFGGATGTTFISGDANLGTDLSNDHPISFTYDSALASTDGELVDPSTDGDTDPDTVGMATPYLPLFSSQLECASCHDVHNTDTQADPLLLVTDAASAICLKCHSK